MMLFTVYQLYTNTTFNLFEPLFILSYTAMVFH